MSSVVIIAFYVNRHDRTFPVFFTVVISLMVKILIEKEKKGQTLLHYLGTSSAL